MICISLFLMTFPKQQHHLPGSLDDALQRGTTVIVAPPPPDDDHLGLFPPRRTKCHVTAERFSFSPSSSIIIPRALPHICYYSEFILF